MKDVDANVAGKDGIYLYEIPEAVRGGMLRLKEYQDIETSTKVKNGRHKLGVEAECQQILR